MKKFLSLVFAICMAMACAFALSACDKPNDPTTPPTTPPGHVHEYLLETYAVKSEKAYKVKKCSCGEYEIKQELVGATIVSPQNLVNSMQNANANATLVLTSGEYSTLSLLGKNSYPQNLTLIGTDGVVIDGVSISSGIKYEDVLSCADKTTLNQEMVDEATLNGNLVFKNMSFSKPVAIRNASIDGFCLYDCKFFDGAGLVINSNVFYNYYDSDSIGKQNTSMKRGAWCYLYTKNIKVENCFFSDVSYSKSGGDSAILLHSVDNLTIKNCVIDGAGYNAVQINGISVCPTKGTIVIESNNFKNTEDRLIRLNAIESGSTVIIKDNVLENSDTDGDSDYEIIKASSVSGVEFEFVGNTYDGEPIEKYDYGVIGIN